MPKIMYLFLTLLGLYLCVVVLVWYFQRNLLYLPDRNMGPPAAYGLVGFEEKHITAAYGVRLVAWYRPARQGFPTIIYFHGNGGHLGYRHNIYRTITDAGFGMLALSWRGYGSSSGSPTEAGLYMDGRATLAFAHDALGIPLAHTILFGESLGTGVAVQMATEVMPGGVVLRSPFTSVANRAAEIYWFLPVRLLLSDRYETLAKIKQVHAPLLILHGTADFIVPVRHGRKLLEAANVPKRGAFFPGMGHNNLDDDAVVKELLAFAREQGLVRGE